MILQARGGAVSGYIQRRHRFMDYFNTPLYPHASELAFEGKLVGRVIIGDLSLEELQFVIRLSVGKDSMGLTVERNVDGPLWFYQITFQGRVTSMEWHWFPNDGLRDIYVDIALVLTQMEGGWYGLGSTPEGAVKEDAGVAEPESLDRGGNDRPGAVEGDGEAAADGGSSICGGSAD